MDDIDTQLASLEERAPMTPQPGDDTFVQQEVTPPVVDPKAAATDKLAEGFKPAATDADDITVIRQKLADFEKKFADKDGMAASERARRRAVEAERDQFAQRVAQFEQMQAAARARAQAGRVPDPEENVVEAVKYERMIRMAQEKQQREQAEQYAAQQQQFQYVNRLKSNVEDFETEFRTNNPDYDEAADFVVDFEEQRLVKMGVPKPQAEQMAVNWAINAADMMLKQGVNPAQAAFEQAKMMGWTPKQQKAAMDKAKADIAAQQQAAALAAQGKLQQQKDGQDAARTMSGGGNPSANDDSLGSMLNLKGAAFDSAVEKYLSGR